MKKTYILILSLLTLGSCSKDFLDSEPITDLTDVNYYKTPQDAFDALVGVYDGMQRISAEGIAVPLASEILSDDCYGGTGNSDGYGFQAIDEFDLSRSPSDTELFNGNWKAYYAAIYRCNVLISKLDQIDWSSDENLRNSVESEVRFIRGYLYFEMVRLWGNIPLLTEASTENIPQADPTEVYTVIAQDLLFAAENLPATPYNSVPNGRVTKWAAKSMLGRVYLYYTGYYGTSDLVGIVSKAEALGHLEDVISTSGHALVNDFSTLWPAASLENYAGEDNSEIVFSVKHTFTSDYNGNTDGNHWMVMFGMREFSYYPYGNGWGVTVSKKLWDAYSEDDTRAVATVIAVEEEGIPFNKIDSQREYTGYYNKKYTPMVDEEGNSTVIPLGGTNFMIGQFQDYFVIRYSDVLLMAAELGSANAQTYFDEVRQRAYKDNFTPIAVSQANIMKERHLEFALEGIRYWDLLRQGVNVAASTISETTPVLSGGIPETKTISSANIELTKGLQQIPNSQITLSNGVLQQNTGW